MKAAIVHEFGAPLQIEEIPTPTPGESEVLVRVGASGLCHNESTATPRLVSASDAMTAYDRSVAHNAANGELFALRRAERQAAAQACELERRLGTFERRVQAVEEQLVVEFRREHWGREPRHLAWRARGGSGPERTGSESTSPVADNGVGVANPDAQVAVRPQRRRTRGPHDLARASRSDPRLVARQPAG
jgi:hypothetical protein